MAAAEVQAQEEADAIAAAVAAKAASDAAAAAAAAAAAGGSGGGGADGGKRRKTLATFWKTKAMWAQRKAALKRRETIEANENKSTEKRLRVPSRKRRTTLGVGAGARGCGSRLSPSHFSEASHELHGSRWNHSEQ